MTKKRRTISGIFNPEEAEAIEQTCAELGINPSQMVREAITLWMYIRPPVTLLKKTHFDELLESMRALPLTDHKQLDRLIEKFSKKYGKSALDNALAKLNQTDINFHAIEKKKTRGRPRIKKKRGKPKM